MPVFRLDPGAGIDGTHYVDQVNIPPRFLVERFGPPAEVDGYKVSGRYTFVGDAGEVFTLYDWKGTTLYHGDESGAPTPAEFWGNRNPETLYIGGRGEENRSGRNPAATAFKEWLLERYRGYRSSLVN